MTVTLAQANQEVRALLNEQTQAFWTDQQINSWINQGCEDVARRAETLWQEVNFQVTALVQAYNFPPDFLNCHRAEFSPFNSNMTYSLDYRGINQMDEIWGILHNLPAAWPQYFTIRGNSVRGFFLYLYPSPGQGGTLTVYYYRQAIVQTNTAGNIDVQPGWEDIVYDYAVFKALRKAQDPGSQAAMQLYTANLTAMIDKTRNMTDLGESITTGIPQWPIYAYTDET